MSNERQHVNLLYIGTVFIKRHVRSEKQYKIKTVYEKQGDIIMIVGKEHI